MPATPRTAQINMPADASDSTAATRGHHHASNRCVTAASIAQTLEQRLAKFKLPKQVFIVDDLPRNTMGKVQKNLLREQYKDIYAPKA